MPSDYLVLRHHLLLLPSGFPSIKVFSDELALHIRWSKHLPSLSSKEAEHPYCQRRSRGSSNKTLPPVPHPERRLLAGVKEEPELPSRPLETQTAAVTWKGDLAGSSTVNLSQPLPFLRIYRREMKAGVHRRPGIRMRTVALFISNHTKPEITPNFTFRGRDEHTMEYFPTMKRCELSTLKPPGCTSSPLC